MYIDRWCACEFSIWTSIQIVKKKLVRDSPPSTCDLTLQCDSLEKGDNASRNAVSTIFAHPNIQQKHDVTGNMHVYISNLVPIGSLCFSLVPIAAVLPQTKAEGIRIYVRALQNAQQAATPSTVGAQAIEAGNHLGGSFKHSMPKSGRWEKKMNWKTWQVFLFGEKRVCPLVQDKCCWKMGVKHDKQPTG